MNTQSKQHTSEYGTTKTYSLTTYESISELLDDISTRKNNKYMETAKSSVTSSESFSGTKSYDEAIALLKNGWEHGAKKLNERLKLKAPVDEFVKRSVQQFGVVGSQAIVPLYLQGVPTNMVRRINTPVKQKIVTLNRGISYSAGVSTEQILDNGLKTIQIIQALENAGSRVKLNVTWAVSAGGQVITMKVCIKQPNERLNISKLAFTLAHPSMLRRIGFKWLEVTPEMNNTGFRYGYGAPCSEDSNKVWFPNEHYIPEFVGDAKGFIDKVSAKKV